MSSFEQVTDRRTEALQRARNMAQMELAKESGKDLITWIGEYANDFGELVAEKPAILERLAQDDTHAEALEEVKKEMDLSRNNFRSEISDFRASRSQNL